MRQDPVAGQNMKVHRKKKHYEELMVRMTKAIAAEFYLQAGWYAYAILEDRLVAVLKRSGGATNDNGTPIKMLGPKLKTIVRRRSSDPLLRVYFDSTLIDAIDKWKNERNTLMHAMADAATPMNKLDEQARLLATRGKELIKSVCRHARQLKNNRHKIPVASIP